ncbi:ABC transporter ATP-binding protein [Celeribacter arenosi]|uniref:ABC transporter ATP-binding protein n=1 Tax=Celeribacter arenosi TaxID=792649 RepID=A0ABP7JYN1_9RHOB
MIHLQDLWKTYRYGRDRTVVAAGLNAVFPTGVTVGLLGRNGAGKSTLLKMIAGTIQPDSGDIHSTGTISWPIGFGGSFHPELTGAQNIRFIARTYGVDTDELTDFVEDFAELGQSFHHPLRTYSSGMKSRLVFGTAMGIGFDTYLVDEVTAVGDEEFKRKSQAVFRERLSAASAVFVSHSNRMILDLCDAGAVIEGGHLYYYDDIKEALHHHRWNQQNLSRVEDNVARGKG